MECIIAKIDIKKKNTAGAAGIGIGWIVDANGQSIGGYVCERAYKVHENISEGELIKGIKTRCEASIK
jgi:pyruvoyl-dependent arginine decarboxylase (PvlArgDC)